MIAAFATGCDLKKCIAPQRVAEVGVGRENPAVEPSTDRIPRNAIVETRRRDRTLRKGVKAGGSQMIGILIEQPLRVARRPVAKTIFMLRQNPGRGRVSAKMKERQVALRLVEEADAPARVRAIEFPLMQVPIGDVIAGIANDIDRKSV